MNIALRVPRMTREHFLEWAEAQDKRYEFDGFEPVAMTGGSNNHSLICQAVYLALGTRLRGGSCRVLGPDAGLATVGNSVRYPDAVVSCTKSPGADRLVPSAVVVFEVLSPTSGRTDRIMKLREYRAVPSVLRYIILEHRSADLLAMSRPHGGADWTATALTAPDTLEMPEIGITVPVAEFYAGVDLPDLGTPDA